MTVALFVDEWRAKTTTRDHPDVVLEALPAGGSSLAISAHTASASGMAAISSRTCSAAALYDGALVTSLTAARMVSTAKSSGPTTMPAPAWASTAAFWGWSVPLGRATCGTPCTRPPSIVPEPLWETSRSARSSTLACGTNSAITAFAGSGPSSSGSIRRPVVAMTTPSYSSNAVRLVMKSAVSVFLTVPRVK